MIDPLLPWQRVRVVGLMGKAWQADPSVEQDQLQLWRLWIWEGRALSELDWDQASGDGQRLWQTKGRPLSSHTVRSLAGVFLGGCRADCHPTTQMVCLGDFQVFSSGFLEGLVGELAATEDLLLPLATRPQGTSGGELVAVDWSRRTLSDLSRG